MEPHDPSRGDNFEKAVGLARFAERHGHLFHRIQLIRKQTSKAGGERFFRLELNSEAARKLELLFAFMDELYGAKVFGHIVVASGNTGENDIRMVFG